MNCMKWRKNLLNDTVFWLQFVYINIAPNLSYTECYTLIAYGQVFNLICQCTSHSNAAVPCITSQIINQFHGRIEENKSSNVIRWHRGWQTLWFPRCLSPSTVAITLPHGPHKSFSSQLKVMQTNQCAVYFTSLPLDRSVRRRRTSNLGGLLEDALF